MKKIILILLIIVLFYFYGIPFLNERYETTNKLKELGYSNEEIEFINEKLNEEEIEELENMEKNKELLKFIKVEYFKYEYLERYTKYANDNNLDNEKIVMYVNIGLDREFYTNTNVVSNPNDKLVLVNKYNSLPDNFEAKNITKFSSDYSYNGQKMEKTAAENIMALINDARKKGYTLLIVSGYRTEEYQRNLYENSINQNGKEHADKYSARPGHSEHQTGLAVDISNKAGVLDGFEQYDVYDWVIENAHKYGFIERYPKGKEFITGYSYEPWHYRFVGVEAATVIHDENITLEEYAVKYLNY